MKFQRAQYSQGRGGARFSELGGPVRVVIGHQGSVPLPTGGGIWGGAASCLIARQFYMWKCNFYTALSFTLFNVQGRLRPLRTALNGMHIGYFFQGGQLLWLQEREEAVIVPPELWPEDLVFCKARNAPNLFSARSEPTEGSYDVSQIS